MSKSVTLSPSAATTGRKKNTTITSIAGAAKVQPASERVVERLRRGHRPGQASTHASPGSDRCGGSGRPPPRPDRKRIVVGQSRVVRLCRRGGGHSKKEK